MIFLYHAITAAVTAGSVLLDGSHLQPWLQFSFRIALFQSLAYAAASLWFIAGAPWLFRWAFREHKGETTAQREERTDP